MATGGDVFHDSLSSQNDDPQELPRPTISHIAVRLPKFWKEEPELWFAQAEANFQAAHITAETTKYSHLLATLDVEVLKHVRDIISGTLSRAPYSTLKSTLITRFSESAEKKLRRLLADTQLGDLLPTQLLRQMEQLAGNSLSSDALKTLWLQRLPVAVQTVLSASNEPLNKLAALGDKVLEASQSQILAAINTGQDDTNPRSNDIEEKLNQIINSLATGQSKYNKQLHFNPRGRDKTQPWSRQNSPERNQPYNHPRHYSPGRDKTRPRSRDGSAERNREPRRTASPHPSSTICWYHETFGKKARKCSNPCSWGDNPN